MISLLMTIIVGALAGWIACAIMKIRGGFLKYVGIGIAGSVVGGLLLSLLGFSAYSTLANLVVAVLGACLFIFIARKILK